MRVISKITGKSYYPENCWIILNPVQVSRFIENGFYPVDIVVGKNRKLCFLFCKTEYGKILFDKWVKHEL